MGTTNHLDSSASLGVREHAEIQKVVLKLLFASQRLLEACIASGDTAEARRLYGDLAAAGAPLALQADALAVLAAAHGLHHESGVEVSILRQIQKPV